jgi:ribonuclease P protein component
LDRRYSLSGRRSFQRLFRQGKIWSEGNLRIRYLLEPVTTPQFAIAVPRSCGNAVVRNRIRRVLREAIRLSVASWPVGFYHLHYSGEPQAMAFETAASTLDRFKSTLVAP